MHKQPVLTILNNKQNILKSLTISLEFKKKLLKL
jgi:hypothetical protein